MDEGPELLPGEEVRSVLRPHPFAFMRQWLIPISLWVAAILLALLYTTDAWATFDDRLATYAGGGLAAIAAFTGVVLALWAILGFALFFTLRRQWIFWLPVLVIGIAVLAFVGKDAPVTSLIYMWAVGILGGLYVELERRSYTYYITDRRIVLCHEFITKRERQVRIEHLHDVVTEQGPLGRMLDFGTIVPISPAQLGSGDDAKALIAGGGVKGPLGKGVVGVGAASIRSKRTTSEDPADVLFGVPRPSEVKTLLAFLLDESSEVGELKKIRGLLEKDKDGPDEDEEDTGEEGGPE